MVNLQGLKFASNHSFRYHSLVVTQWPTYIVVFIAIVLYYGNNLFGIKSSEIEGNYKPLILHTIVCNLDFTHNCVACKVLTAGPAQL